MLNVSHANTFSDKLTLLLILGVLHCSICYKIYYNLIIPYYIYLLFALSMLINHVIKEVISEIYKLKGN